MELSEKAGVFGRPRESADCNYSEGDKTNRRVEGAGYRSPTCALLRALQQINSATSIEGEAAMSAPPFFQSAGRGDLLFWGVGEGPTVVTWESLSEQEKASWLEEASTMHDWVVWCRSKKGAEEIRSFELSEKEIFSDYDATKSKDEKNKRRGAKRRHIAGRAYDTGHSGSKATSNWQ